MLFSLFYIELGWLSEAEHFVFCFLHIYLCLYYITQAALRSILSADELQTLAVGLWLVKSKAFINKYVSKAGTG